LALRLPHRRPRAAYHERHSGDAGDAPFGNLRGPWDLDELHLLDVHALAAGRLEEDHRALRHALESLRIAVGEGRHHDLHADLEAAARAQLGERAVGEPAQELTHRRQQPLLLDRDRRITEARGELERIDAIAVHDAID